ncbi:MAG TPA: gamma-glutamyltransferase [Polyangia bacterium]|jgi:gamma-glutamyltranspeptidase/glutathione hydrolase
MSDKYVTVDVWWQRRFVGGDLCGRRRGSVGLLIASTFFFAAFAVDLPSQAATPPPLHAAHEAVASDNPSASQAGLSRLRAGGNAIDAACATALALGVVHPFASGMGGGGFAVIYIAKEHKTYALDFRERAPAAITPALFLRDGKADPSLSRQGGLAAAVPGEVRGLGEMVRRWGKLPFGKCVEPAERLAKAGFPVSWRLAEALQEIPRSSPPADPIFAQVFAGKPPHENEIARRPDLAWTLGQLRTGGAQAFYSGPVAAAIVSAVRAAGGVMTADDLKAYTAVERVPLETTYRGLRVLSMPPPSSGGTVLIETLGILSARFPDGPAAAKVGRNSSAYLHVLGEAFKHGFADRARFLGDPDFVSIDVAHLIDPAYHRSLAARIKDDGVLPRDQYGTPDAPPAVHHDGGTTHLAVIDADGNAVSMTTTVNLGFGAKLIAGKTGILLNNEMDDFSVQPGVPNAFGLIGNAQNAVAPNKRPLSSMTPTVVLDGDQVKMVVGAAGGPTIITATAQVLLNVVDWKLDAQAAVAAPRIHDQWFPELLMIESDVPRDVVDGLERRKQKTKELPKIGVANVIVRTANGLDAGAEPRSPSTPAGD